MMYFVRLTFSANMPYSTRDMPMVMAKRQGPNKSPTVLETPRAVSAKRDAHCAMASSDAPEQSIRIRKTQKIFMPKSLRMGILVSSLVKELMGTRENRSAVSKGIIAQSAQRSGHMLCPKKTKNAVVPKTASICPQQ